MKRIIGILLTVTILLSVCSLGLTSNAVYVDERIYGDINNDGLVSTEDALMALQITAGLLDVDGDAYIRGDIDEDGFVTLYDARQILRAASKLTSVQPSGAFSGFEQSNTSFTEEKAIELFNSLVNNLKTVDTEGEPYINATVTKLETEKFNDSDSAFKIGYVDTAIGSANTAALTAQIKNALSEDDKIADPSTVPYGETNLDLIEIAGSGEVSNLTVDDVFGLRIFVDENNLLVIKIALKDTEIDKVWDSAYSKVYNVQKMYDESTGTLFKVIGSSTDEELINRVFKNGVLTVKYDLTSSKLCYYSLEYTAYAKITEFVFGNIIKTTFRDVEYEKDYKVEYTDIIWPKTQNN